VNYIVLFWTICVIYSGGWLIAVVSFFSNDKYGKSWVDRILLLGLVLQFVYIGLDLISLGNFLFDSLAGLFLFLSFFTILIFIILEYKFPNQIFKIIFPPVAVFFLILSITISDQAIIVREFLDKSPGFGRLMLMIHASSAMLGYLLFGVACLTSMFYLYQENMIKSKRLILHSLKVPSLGFLDKLNYKVIAIGFLFLSVGLLLGINMKVIATGGQIEISLRQILPVATWLIYAFFLIDRFINGLRGKITPLWAITGFFAAVTSFFYEVFLLVQRS
jgi:ABC-type uncharacterized transport system permease subunit